MNYSEIGPVYAQITDVNIAGVIHVIRDTLEELADELERFRGLWHDYDGGGVAILDNPEAHVYLGDREGSAYPAYVLKDGTVTEAR